MKNVELAIKTEQYHRICFDKIFVQDYKSNKEDEVILKEYDKLFKSCPNFRQICFDEFLRLSKKVETDKEKANFESLKTINFNRYSVKKPS